MDKLLSVQEVASRLGLSFWTVYRMARDGRLASIRLGRRRLFAVTDLEDLVSATREGRYVPSRAGVIERKG